MVNDNGGTAVAANWTLGTSGATATQISGLGGAASGADFLAGAYTMGEIGPAGYDASAWICTGNGTQVGNVITLGVGESASCTIVNNDSPPSLTLIKSVINDNGGTAVPGDWTLTATGPTGFSGTSGVSSDASFSVGSYDLSESALAGYSQAGDWSCVGGTQNDGDTITIGLDEDVTCTVTNNDIPPSLTLIKVVDNGDGDVGTSVATDWILSATGPTGFSGTTGVSSDASFDQGSYDLSESGPGAYVASNWNCVGDGNQTDGDTISLGLGDSATCTITNSSKGMVNLLKLTNGQENQTMKWFFTLDGADGLSETDMSPPTTIDFDNAKLTPGVEYTLCETGIPGGWTTIWEVDTTGDGVPDTMIPHVPNTNYDPVDSNTGFSRVYDPNWVAFPSQYTNDTKCVNFVVDVGQNLAFKINNTFPGGDPRTIGFWKNWNTCTNGNQYLTAAENGGPDAGWYILDDLLNDPGYDFGDLTKGSPNTKNGHVLLDGDDCELAVLLLDKRDFDGRKRASDAAYNLSLIHI